MTPTIREWIKQMSDHNFPFRTLDEGLEIEDEDEDDDQDDVCQGQRELDVDPLCDWSKKNFKCEGGRKDKNGNIFGKVWISLPCGGEFRGYVEAGRREGLCQVTCLENGIRMLRASYYNDRPEGFVSLEREDGSLREGFCLDGKWDGMVREFDEDRVIKFVGRYEAGVPSGPCWLRVRGGSWLCGDMDPAWRLTSENGSYLYPDLETGYNGVFRHGVMVAARAAIIVADKVLDSVLRVKVSKVWGPGREFKEASEETLSTLPLLRDPYEERLTEVRRSEVPGGGEGLFAKVDIEPGTLVAIYNGVKRGPYAEVSPESWDQCGYSIGYYESTTAERGWGDMDIPVKFQSTENYVATTAHKMNHSFSCNCEFSDLDHPVYGYVPCTVTSKPVRAGQELFVHYHYVLDDCPQWYEDLYNTL